MYESLFHFKGRPFAAAPRTDRYYPAGSIEYARETLARCVQRAEGPGLLIGPAGTGKSLVCQLLAEQFHDSSEVVTLATAKLCTRRALLQNILHELGQPYRGMDEGELRLSLIDHLQLGGSGGGMLLLVDEASTLPMRLLEEIRMLTNLAHEGQPRVRLVLAGGPTLEERFADPALESFNQRIAARCYLHAMNRDETCQYVRAQIDAVGGNASAMLNNDSLAAIYTATGGIPRLVNQVCDHALVMAAQAGRTGLDARTIEEAWADLQQLPTPWQAGDKSSAGGENVIEFGELDDARADSALSIHIEPGEANDIDEMSDDGTVELKPIHDSDDRTDDASLAVEFVSDVQADAEERHVTVAMTSAQATIAEHAHPFDESYDEEEVVVDHYASLVAVGALAPPEANGGHLSELTESLAARAAKKAPSTAASAEQNDAEVTDTADANNEDEEQVDVTNETPRRATDERADNEPMADNYGASEKGASDSGDVDNGVVDNSEPQRRVIELDDRDIIVVVDERADGQPSQSALGRARRREYRQLFTQLRRN